jgi:hypothetical protein
MKLVCNVVESPYWTGVSMPWSVLEIPLNFNLGGDRGWDDVASRKAE